MAKKVAKKKVTKKKVTKRAAPARPSYQASSAASKDMTQKEGLYFDMKDSGTYILRVQPRLDNNPSIFTKSVLHYGFTDADDPTRPIALGCLDHHGTEETGTLCYISQVAQWLCMQDDPEMNKLGDGFGSIGSVEIVYVQAWVMDSASKTWKGPKLIKVPSGPKGVAPKLSAMLSVSEDMGTAPFVDFDQGQAIAVTRDGAGRNTEWSVQSTGNFIGMDDVDKDWVGKIIHDVPAKLGVKTWTREEQRKTAQRCYPALPWGVIDDNIG